MSLKLLLLFLHLLCAAAWLGCILVEVVYERSIDTSLAMRRFVSQLHWRTDLSIEGPALLGVSITGGALLSMAPASPLLSVKIAFGGLAVLSNLICILLVKKRLDAACASEQQRYERLDHLQHKVGALVLIGVLVALVLGGYLFSRGQF